MYLPFFFFDEEEEEEEDFGVYSRGSNSGWDDHSGEQQPHPKSNG